MSVRQRWSGSVYDEGTEPDYRFSFANERTFLAWVRWTAAERALRRQEPLPSFGFVLPFVLVLVGGTLCLWGCAESRRRHARQHARRERGRPRDGRAVLALSVATGLIAVTELATLGVG